MKTKRTSTWWYAQLLVPAVLAAVFIIGCASPAAPISAPAPSALPAKVPTEAELRMAASLAMRPNDAAEISDMFFAASARERAQILHNLQETPLKAAARGMAKSSGNWVCSSKFPQQ